MSVQNVIFIYYFIVNTLGVREVTSLCNETSFHSAEGIFLEVVQKGFKAFRKFSKSSGVTFFNLA